MLQRHPKREASGTGSRSRDFLPRKKRGELSRRQSSRFPEHRERDGNRAHDASSMARETDTSLKAHETSKASLTAKRLDYSRPGWSVFSCGRSIAWFAGVLKHAVSLWHNARTRTGDPLAETSRVRWSILRTISPFSWRKTLPAPVPPEGRAYGSGGRATRVPSTKQLDGR